MSYVQKRRVTTITSTVQYWSTCELFFRVAGKVVNGWCFPHPQCFYVRTSSPFFLRGRKQIYYTYSTINETLGKR